MIVKLYTFSKVILLRMVSKMHNYSSLSENSLLAILDNHLNYLTLIFCDLYIIFEFIFNKNNTYLYQTKLYIMNKM